MTKHPIDRPLTDTERNIMLRAAVEVVAKRAGISDDAAAATLDDIAGRDEVRLSVDEYDARVVVSGFSIAHMTREDLAFAALTIEGVDQ